MTAPVGRPEKYTTHVQPHLERIGELRKQGMKLDSIAKELHIAPDTLYRYKNDYPELSEILNTAQKELYADMVVVAEDSLYKKLQDRFEVVEVRKGVTFDKNGNPHEYEDIVERRVPADTTALIFTLKNRNSDYWRDRTEVDATVLHGVIPQPLAPVREQDVIEGETVEVDSDDETD